MTLTLSGSHSPPDPCGAYPGYTARGAVSCDIRDHQTGDVFASGYHHTSDATPPSFTLVVGVVNLDAVTPGASTLGASGLAHATAASVP